MKLRLLVTEECNRNCIGCCNKDWDLKDLPPFHFVSRYDCVMITGGEPMLFPNSVASLSSRLKDTDITNNVIVYSAMMDFNRWKKVLPFIDGITLTLHHRKDVQHFYNLEQRLRDSKYLRWVSLRLNIFKGIEVYPDKDMWKIKKDIEWIKDCPLPEGESFKRLKETWKTT